MLRVIFLDRFNQERELAFAPDVNDGIKVIYNFLKLHNYKSPYMRIWKRDDTHIIFDVGSHTEFFLIEGTPAEINKELEGLFKK